YHPNEQHDEIASLTKIETPQVHTAQALATFLAKPLDEITTSMVFSGDGEFIMLLVRGHHGIDAVKLKAFFGTYHIELATEDEIKNLLRASPGSLGPIFDKNIKVYADNFIKDLNNIVVGANEDGYHLLNANVGRDFEIEAYGDFR